MSITIQKLAKFSEESQSELKEIKVSLNEFNIFNVLGVQRREIRHSNFLGWLFDPGDSHQLGDVFLKDLLKLISETGSLNSERLCALLKQDLSETIVYRESVHNIDLLLVNQTKDFVVCIENKIDANFSDHQLAKYYTYVEKHYKKIKHRCYITLTPFKTSHHTTYECGEYYNNINYSQIVEIIRSHSNRIEDAKSTVKESINQYCTMIEKDITQTNPEVRMAQRIYKEHKDAIEFILSHKPNFKGLNHGIWDSIKNNEIEGFIFTVEEPKDDIIRILPNNQDLLNLFRKPEYNSWESEFMFCLEIMVEPDYIWIRWSFGNINNQSREQELLNERSELYIKMKKMDVYKNSGIPFDYHTYINTKDNFPGVGGVKLLNENEYLAQDKSALELFKEKFSEVNIKLIKPWTEACIEQYKKNIMGQ